MHAMEVKDMAIPTHWNRCDVCGKFISYDDFDSGLAVRYMKTPDTHFTAETYMTLCRDHSGRCKNGTLN